jgi:TolB protein
MGTANADGANVTRLTNNPAIDGISARSPDRSQIAFSTDWDGDAEVYVMAADGSNQTNLTNNPASDIGGNWSPGRRRDGGHHQ